MLELDVTVDRRDLVVEIALRVARGERVALFGPSGAGKTTLLETIAGLVAPRAGSIVLCGRTLTSTASPRVAVPVWQRRVGLLRQEPALFPHLSVAANLAYDRRGRGGDGRARARVAERLGIAALLGARPGALSGGQAQRVALGRALLAGVDALLLDEPYAGLDAELRRNVTDIVAESVRQDGLASVLVAHELTEAQAFAERLGIVDAGRILQVASPHELVARPASRRVAELVGYRFATAAPGESGGGTAIGVHPGRVVPGAHADAGHVLSGTVMGRRAVGPRWEVDVELATGAGAVTCELAELPPSSVVELTALDPPEFSLATGALVARGIGTRR